MVGKALRSLLAGTIYLEGIRLRQRFEDANQWWREQLKGFRIFHEVGIAPDYILRSATTAAAAAIGLSDVTGSIEPGLSADLVGFGGNPLEEIDAYFRPRAVFVRGQLISAVA